jgi:hypothetical protein
VNSTPTPQHAPADHPTRQSCPAVYARELTIAVPRTVSDIYLLHQAVWGEIDASRDGRLCSPEILYRRDAGCVSVRIGAASLKHGRTSSFAAQTGQVRRFSLRCALWRDLRQQSRSPHRRVAELFSNAGCELLDHQVNFGVASGYKAVIKSSIQLPVADLRGSLRIIDHHRALQAWRLGVGRGRRFGFGMLVFQD